MESSSPQKSQPKTLSKTKTPSDKDKEKPAGIKLPTKMSHSYVIQGPIPNGLKNRRPPTQYVNRDVRTLSEEQFKKMQQNLADNPTPNAGQEENPETLDDATFPALSPKTRTPTLQESSPDDKAAADWASVTMPLSSNNPACWPKLPPTSCSLKNSRSPHQHDASISFFTKPKPADLLYAAAASKKQDSKPATVVLTTTPDFPLGRTKKKKGKNPPQTPDATSAIEEAATLITETPSPDKPNTLALKTTRPNYMDKQTEAVEKEIQQYLNSAPSSWTKPGHPFDGKQITILKRPPQNPKGKDSADSQVKPANPLYTPTQRPGK